jgi:Flp pilus assembly protein TadD
VSRRSDLVAGLRGLVPIDSPAGSAAFLARRARRAAPLAALVWFAAAVVSTAQVPTPRSPGVEPLAGSARATAPASPASFVSFQRQLADATTRGDLAAAAAIAERQHRLFPDEMKATADLGAAELARGDTQRAEALLRSAIGQPTRLFTGRVAPVIANIYANLGRIALAKNRPQDAVRSLRTAIVYAPEAAPPRYDLASALAAVGDTERSARELRAAFALDLSAARPSDYRLMARLCELTGNELGAARAFDALLARNPSDIDVRLEHAALMRRVDRRASALFDLLYARMLAHADDPRLAAIADGIAELRAESASPRSDRRLAALFSYLDDAASGRYDDALLTIRDVMAAEPNAFVPRLLLARACAETGRMAEAERTLEQLVAEDGSSVPALAELVSLMYRQTRLEAASALVDRARRLDAENVRLREVVAAWEPESGARMSSPQR